MRSTKAATAASASAVILMCSIACASSSFGKGLNLAVVGSGAADVVSTQVALDSGCCRELNAVMGSSLLRQSLLKAAGISTVIASAHLVEIKRPVLAHLVRGIAITAWSVAAWHNWQLARR